MGSPSLALPLYYRFCNTATENVSPIFSVEMGLLEWVANMMISEGYFYHVRDRYFAEMKTLI